MEIIVHGDNYIKKCKRENKMNDSISRQAAINEANAWLLDCLKVNKQDRSCGLIRRLEDLPSAQPATDTNVGTRDMIDRQQAIDTVLECYDNGEFFDGYEYALKNLPSAQPEIIRCKDCKYWIPYDWMFSEVWQSRNIADYPEDEIGCKYCDMNMKADDYCSRAERREVTK